MLFSLSSLSLFTLAVSSVANSRPIVNRSYGAPAPFTPRASIPVTLGGVQIGFNEKGGNFDDFFGVGNFAGNLNEVDIIQQQQQLVCRSSDLVRVRQQLAVIQEFAKQIILQQVCEVEIQTVIIQQVSAQFVNFGRNVRRSGRNVPPSFDLVIAQKITQITQVINLGGNLRDLDLGFLGSDIGRNSVRIGGGNWNDATSPGSVGNAYRAAKDQEKKKGKGQQERSTSSDLTATATETATSSAATETATETATNSVEATATNTAEATATNTAEATVSSTEASATESTASATQTPTNERK